MPVTRPTPARRPRLHADRAARRHGRRADRLAGDDGDPDRVGPFQLQLRTTASTPTSRAGSRWSGSTRRSTRAASRRHAADPRTAATPTQRDLLFASAAHGRGATINPSQVTRSTTRARPRRPALVDVNTQAWTRAADAIPAGYDVQQRAGTTFTLARSTRGPATSAARRSPSSSTTATPRAARSRRPRIRCRCRRRTPSNDVRGHGQLRAAVRSRFTAANNHDRHSAAAPPTSPTRSSCA